MPGRIVAASGSRNDRLFVDQGLPSSDVDRRNLQLKVMNL
jgi:hypothetical protein